MDGTQEVADSGLRARACAVREAGIPFPGHTFRVSGLLRAPEHQLFIDCRRTGQ
ncbi:hypothetical protein [Streptomyces sp. VRA16 Mangrove soil]|uniref:hypothetical protein n=1 Tax=Streptomyces sp. VRA16 Mangrove soil TaxID=2817434 RepID=UPI001A9E3000|nr:hypothetical protein [Streptomyces sp. VRA16 Mangrove soil]MBO1334638.1 hypothetical protein [Streptomyces sp. VRA16 Mangrove soil]